MALGNAVDGLAVLIEDWVREPGGSDYDYETDTQERIPTEFTLRLQKTAALLAILIFGGSIRRENDLS